MTSPGEGESQVTSVYECTYGNREAVLFVQRRASCSAVQPSSPNDIASFLLPCCSGSDSMWEKPARRCCRGRGEGGSRRFGDELGRRTRRWLRCSRLHHVPQARARPSLEARGRTELRSIPPSPHSLRSFHLTPTMTKTYIMNGLIEKVTPHGITICGD